MSLLFLSGFETGNYVDDEFVSWTATIQSSIKKTGTYAARLNPTGGGDVIITPQRPYKRLSFWFYVASLPAPEDGYVTIVNRQGADTRCGIQINSNGQIQLRIVSYDEQFDYWDSNFTISTGQWYRVCVCVQWNSGTSRGKTRLYVDGVLINSDDDGYATWIGWVFGFVTAETYDVYLDDIVFDDDESLEDMGNRRILRAGITGAGEYTEFDSEVGSATHFENVDELSYNDADYNYDTANSGSTKESYALQNSSAMGLIEADVIKAVKTTCRGKRGGGGGTVHNILRRDNGVDVEEPISLSTSFNFHSQIDESLPNGGDDWTQGRLDGLEVGMSYNGGARDPYLSHVSVMVIFGDVVVEEPPSVSPALQASVVNQPTGGGEMVWGW